MTKKNRMKEKNQLKTGITTRINEVVMNNIENSADVKTKVAIFREDPIINVVGYLVKLNN